MVDPAETEGVAGGDELEARRQRRRTTPAVPVPGSPAAEVIPLLTWRTRSAERARLLTRIQEMLRPD